MSEPGFDVAALDGRLAPVVRGRRVIVMSAVAAGATESVDQLLRYGAQRPLVLGHASGLGAVPSTQDAEVILHPLAECPATMSAELQAHNAFVADLPSSVVDAVQAYDPDCSAVWWLMSIVDVAETLLGRQVLGGRRPSWGTLEDKTLGDAVFDAAGIRRPTTLVVPAETSALRAAARDLDSGAGTVWSGDAREGVNGGGEFVRWVRTTGAAVRAIELFEAHCDRVRVAPFLDGIPCSIHGIVLPDGVAVLRPVELLVPEARTTGSSTPGCPPGGIRRLRIETTCVRPPARSVNIWLEPWAFAAGSAWTEY